METGRQIETGLPQNHRLQRRLRDRLKRRLQRRHLLGDLAQGLIAALWPAPSASSVTAVSPGSDARQPASAMAWVGSPSGVGNGYYDLPTYRRRGIRIPELENER
jgi:hypothetical protein